MVVDTLKRLYTGQPGTAITTLYTVPASTTTIARNIVLTNTTGTSATIDIHFVPSAGTASASNKIVSTYTVAGNDTVVIDLNAVLETDESIQSLQGTAGSVTVYISGIEVV